MYIHQMKHMEKTAYQGGAVYGAEHEGKEAKSDNSITTSTPSSRLKHPCLVEANAARPLA
jgi:hypothetical protein